MSNNQATMPHSDEVVVRTNRDQIIGEHFRWIAATSEIEDHRDLSRRPDTSYEAKVDVYEDRVKFWFLEIAKSLVQEEEAPGDYVALSIAVAYIEGAEQYRRGRRTPNHRSGEWFRAGIRRIFPDAPSEAADRLWEGVRNGLFHDGFTKGPVLVSQGQPGVMALRDRHLIVNPAHFLSRILKDFEVYVQLLRADPSSEVAAKFLNLWDEQWNAT